MAMSHVFTTVDMKQDTNILVVYSNFLNIGLPLSVLENSKHQKLESPESRGRIQFP